MEFIQVGEFAGQAYNFKEVASELLEPAFSKVFHPNVKFLIINWHKMEIPITMDVMNKMIAPYISLRSKDNSNIVVVVNWGWAFSTETRSIYDYTSNKGKICRDDAIRFDENQARNGEIASCPKSVGDKESPEMAVWYKTRLGYSVLYFLWDAFHCIGEDGVKEILREITPFASKAYKKGVFLEKFYPKKKVSVEGVPGKEEQFVSIYDKALELIGGEQSIPSIKAEMIANAPIKQLVLFVNQLINSPIQHKTDSKAHTDKKEISKWLEDWADKKWPYYVMFGHKFEVQLPITYEIDLQRDKFTIKALISDIKAQFPKYALVIDQFKTKDIIENKISQFPDSLTEFAYAESGMKLSKFLSSFLDDKDFDVALSKIVGLTKLDSIIHISIDPMDFMTSSVNKCGWTTCQNIYNGGRGNGALSFMFDEGSLIAFMASNKHFLYDLDGKGKPFLWNSKSWRQLVYGDCRNNSFIFVREYPTEGMDNRGLTKDKTNDIARENTRKFFEKIVSDFCGTSNLWVIKRNGSLNCKHHEVIAGQYGYEDIKENGRPHVLVYQKCHKNFPKIKVGAKIKCIKTGGIIQSSKALFSDGSI